MKNQPKLEARARITQILTAALEIAPARGYARLTREDIATRAKVPPSLITYHFGTMPELRRKIMREAVRVKCLPVIAQGIACRDRIALKAPQDVQALALDSLRG